VDEKDYREVLHALDSALTQFGDRPTETGFDLAIYAELRKARETLIRAQRDARDPKVKKRDSRSPLGSS
jgi:hypothetical protein